MDKNLMKNARKPEGELGSQLLDRMNRSHEELAQWGVSHLDIKKNDIILDIGCGGGVNVKRFSEIATEGTIYGMDYSDVSIDKSNKLNKNNIETGNVKIIKGSVSKIPFEDKSFNIVTAFETIYFWTNIVDDLKEIHRVLKNNGLIFICNEAVGDEDVLLKTKEYIELLDMTIYSEENLKNCLSDSGFSTISTYRKKGTDWICATAYKM